MKGPAETKGLVRENSKQLHAKKSDSLDEIDTFLEKQKLLRLSSKSMKNLTRFQTVVKMLPSRKSPESQGLDGESCESFK